MDHFERELARMMRDSQEYTPFEAEHGARLRAGVRAHRRVRTVRRTAGSVLAVAGLGIGFFLLPHDPGENRPQAPHPQPIPATSPASPGPTPTGTAAPPSPTSSGSPTGAAGEPTAPATTSTATSDAPSATSTATHTEAPPPDNSTATSTAPATPTNTPSNLEASSSGSADPG
ncbi:hypothetical protein LXH13_03940 [Streptomyces spinosirectus]|jgi:hypothetical protein|uniref:hypothetical protein n=1 Tax=Streptomyces TaxID=1883 RepID=UPI001C9DB43B|nr:MULTISPECIES: hypothetical protein [Streptomyces]MBY8341515.1 hypothetical protein [Streptomyces plumbidurans]UIR16230.1 hypothetical protein LXH13_03940 [Streptomyces spinosirectus]